MEKMIQNNKIMIFFGIEKRRKMIYYDTVSYFNVENCIKNAQKVAQALLVVK